MNDIKRNSIDLNGENLFPVVSVEDDCIDWTKVDPVEYARTRDFKKLQDAYLPGKQPTIFYLRHLPATLRSSIGDIVSGKQLTTVLMGFKWCVARIDNLKRSDGVTIPTWEPSVKFAFTKARQHPLMSDDELNYLDEHLSFSSMVEVGGVASTINFLHNGKSITFAVPHFLESRGMNPGSF